MSKILFILAHTEGQAISYAKEHPLDRWIYVQHVAILYGFERQEYIVLPYFDRRADAATILAEVQKRKMVERT